MGKILEVHFYLVSFIFHYIDFRVFIKVMRHTSNHLKFDLYFIETESILQLD